MHRFIQSLTAAALLLTFLTATATAEAQQPAASESRQAEREPPQAKQETQSRRHVVAAAQKPPISRTRYLVGGFVGTIYGMGLGHAIVGEYGTTGWRYTIAGLATSVGAAYLGYNMVQKPRWSNSDIMFMAAAGIVAGAVRIAEIRDLWARPRVAGASPNTSNTAFAIGPVDSDGGWGATFQLQW